MATLTPLAPPSPARLWTRNFTLYFLARTVAMLGDAMLTVTVALAVRGAGHGDSGVGYVLAAWMVPFIALLLFGGVYADRFSAQRMMIGADLVRVVTQAAMAVALFAAYTPLWLLIGLSAVSGAAAAMFQPGVAGLVPRVAGDVQRANATLRVADALAQLTGPAVAALLVSLIGAGMVYAVNATNFVVSAVCLFALRLAAVPLIPKGSTMRADLRAGWVEFRGRTWMWSIILIWMVFGSSVYGPLIPLGSGLVTGQHGEQAYGWVMSALGAGTILGGLVALRLRPARPLAAGGVALFGFALVPLAIAAGGSMPVLLAAHAAGGASWAFWSVMWATSVQTQIPPDVLNRVSAYEVAGSVSGVPVGQALAGPLAAAFGASVVLGAGSVITVGVCLAVLAVPAVRNLRRIG
ncbi:MFS transporter [Longispora albida]|uniref:MFS transporter n=1 Tax=Longispora albida TaxID=203523 RepID=UPI00039BE696|nr:MFS transporter [Longispora albida]